MSLTKTLVGALALLVNMHSVYAGDGSGLEFLLKCGGQGGELREEKAAGVAYCIGFVEGMIEMQKFLVAAQNAKPMYCEPQANFSNLQALFVVKKWLMDNPELLHISQRALVIRALRETYPCNQ